MKRIGTIFLCLLWAGGIFAGGRGESAPGDGSATVRYGFWGNPDSIGVEQEIIDAFEESHPGILIEPVVAGYNEYHTKLLTLLAGGMAPDVMRIDSYFFQDFTKTDALMALDDLVARDGVDMGAYYQQGVVENSYEGALYGLPWATAALYMLINLDVMEQAGLDLPSMDWTMEDFTALVEAFEEEEELYGTAMDLNSLSSMLPFVWAGGGDVFSSDRSRFTMNAPEATAALQTVADLYRRGLMPQDTITADADTLSRWFINNKIAMRMGSAAEILSLQKVDGIRFEAWPMPGGVRRDTTVFKSNIVGLNKNTALKEEAWTFLKFLRGPEGEGETLYMKAKRMPPCIDDERYWALYADPAKYPKMIEENSRKIAEIYGHNLPIRPGWLEVQQLIVPAYQQIFLGEMSAREAMDKAAPKVQAVLDRTAE